MNNDATQITPFRGFEGERLVMAVGRWTVSEDHDSRYLWLRSKSGCQNCAGAITDADLNELGQLVTALVSPRQA